MKKILIFGNSGSGKSTLAKQLCQRDNLAHLDLDILAWLPNSPPQRQPLDISQQQIKDFIDTHGSWVIEGCYTDLLEFAATFSNQLIYLDLPVEACLANAQSRPWEPHKYQSKQAQDANLPMLLDWITQYYQREDVFSAKAHQSFYQGYQGDKVTYKNNNFEIFLD